MDVNATLMSIKCVFNILVLHITAQKMKFSIKISSVNMTKFAGNYRLGHIY